MYRFSFAMEQKSLSWAKIYYQLLNVVTCNYTENRWNIFKIDAILMQLSNFLQKFVN